MSSPGFLVQARQHLAVGASLVALVANLGTPLPAAAQEPAKAPAFTFSPIKHVIVIIGRGTLKFIGKPMAPESNERPAWKDTIKTYAGYVIRVVAKFDLPAGTPVKPGDEFRYVWHCHVLEHQDNEMMRPYKIVA